MATIPIVQRQVTRSGEAQQRINPGALPSSLYTTAEADTQVARGLAQLGAGIVALAEGRDDVAVNEAIYRYSQLENDLMNNENNGILRRVGQAAQTAGGDAENGLASYRNSIARDLTRAQANKFLRSTDRSQLAAVKQATVHGANQMAQYNEQLRVSGIQASGLTIANAPLDPEVYEAEYVKALALNTSMHGESSDEATLVRLDHDTRKELSQAAIQALVQQNPGQAMAFLRSRIGDFTDDEFKILESQITQATLPYFAEQAGRELIQKYGIYNSEGALQDIRENVPETRQTAYINAYQGALNERRRIVGEQIASTQNEAMEILKFGNMGYNATRNRLAPLIQQLRDLGESASAANLIDLTQRQFQVGEYAPRPTQVALDPVYTATVMEAFGDLVENNSGLTIDQTVEFIKQNNIDPRLTSRLLNARDRIKKRDESYHYSYDDPGADAQRPGVNSVVSGVLSDYGITGSARNDAENAFWNHIAQKETLEQRRPTIPEIQQEARTYFAQNTDIVVNRTKGLRLGSWQVIAPRDRTRNVPLWVADQIKADPTIQYDSVTGTMTREIVLPDGTLTKQLVRVDEAKDVMRPNRLMRR